MKVIRMRIRMIVAVMLACFLAMAAYCCYCVYFYGGRWVANPYNPRISSQKKTVEMGSITDRSGVLLAYSDTDGKRRYNTDKALRRAVSQTVGDSGGKVSTGADTFYAPYLLGFKTSVFERLADAVTGTPLRGDDVQLTISAELSKYIAEKFPKDKRGAVVVLNYRTGEILSMVSVPGFDPTDMDAALDDAQAGALINRATQGLYPPGSTFKLVTMAAALEQLPNMDAFGFSCTGYYPVGHYSVTESTAHGMLSLSGALEKSCNTAFAALSQELGYEKLGRTAEKLGFNRNFLFSDLIVYNSSYPIDNLSPEDLAWSAIGQGRVLATPMHMALVAATIANGGEMIEPRLVKRITTAKGGTRALPGHAKPERMLEADTAERIRKDMIGVVKSGTGRSAAISGYTVAGKTGSAEISDDKNVETHAWFSGFIADEKAPYAVCVLVEKGGAGGSVAAPLARRALQKAIELGL